MPNTPLLLGEGATALAKDDSVSDAEFAVVRNIFGSCGMTAVIAPEQMKEVIAINGSSPAFIYLFAKGFLDYAARVGLPEQSAKELFVQSLIGSAKMITDSGCSIDELIRQVSLRAALRLPVWISCMRAKCWTQCRTPATAAPSVHTNCLK